MTWIALTICVVIAFWWLSQRSKIKTEEKRKRTVVEINEWLEQMDKASDSATLTSCYYKVIDLMDSLPKTTMLNNMDMAQAKNLVNQEFCNLKCKLDSQASKPILHVVGVSCSADSGNSRIVGTNHSVLRDSKLTDGKFNWNVIDLGNGMIKAKHHYLIKRYMPGAVITEDLLFADEDSQGYVTFPKSVLDEMEQKLQNHKKREHSLQMCAVLNNKGIELEKQGKIDAAIAIYEQNISGDCYPATHSFDRLMVLYRKRKEFSKEKRVIEKAITLFPSIAKYRERLEKVNALISRANTDSKAFSSPPKSLEADNSLDMDEREEFFAT